ncbi:MAG: glycosyltransferase family 2 protein [Steroidobacteraceae bacterium]
MPVTDIVVVIVSYRSAALTIESVRALDAERTDPALRLRVVVVDNDSGDYPAIAAAIVANGWATWVSLLASPRNGGFAFGNNIGIGHAWADGRPDYVYLLNPDAQVRPGAVAALVRFLEDHPGAGIAGSAIENSDGSDWPIAFRFPSLLSELNDGLELGLVSRLLRNRTVARTMSGATERVDWVSGASMMIRTSVFEAIGGMDENFFLYFEETDFCWRAMRAAFTTWYVPEARVMHMRGRSTNLSMMEASPKRLPDCWFESRRRYFALRFGVPRAIAIDAVALAAHFFGALKRTILLRGHRGIPHFLRDLFHNSLLKRRNRNLPSPTTLIANAALPAQPAAITSPAAGLK